jgi:hypothetical protein
MTVEDCVLFFYNTLLHTIRSPVNTWDYSFIRDINNIIVQNKSLSSAQTEVCLKIIKKYQFFLVKNGLREKDIKHLLEFPSYKLPPYESQKKPRVVRWIGDNHLIFKCSYNRIVVDAIKQLTVNNNFIGNQHPRFNRKYTFWLVRVNESNIDKVMEVIKRHCFDFDNSVEQYLLHCKNAQEGKKTNSVEMHGDYFKISVICDDFLDSWLNDLKEMDDSNV